ncbi:MAG: tRNA uridine-5-carboxymethylaminomethyl(34) synthesis GTPase MnmE, partial [Oscillospiraceae bacterium]
METVCAISTPVAPGGISVVRISGDEAIAVASKIFQPVSCGAVKKMPGYTCCFGKIISKGELIDEGILTIFRSPKSYTGEDVAEISCHGGIHITKRVLRAAVENGAAPAQAGEFTKRAFLNGKLSLTQAEAVMDLISAQGEQSRRFALSVHEGALFLEIQAASKKLLFILSELAAWVDYPDEELPDIEAGALIDSLNACIMKLEKLLGGYDSGRIFRDGVDTVITGKPNVGKSTLMNLLLGFERSIVTDIPGTTRDVVEETVRVGEMLLKLSDTAGVRSAADAVEAGGVKLAYKR